MKGDDEAARAPLNLLTDPLLQIRCAEQLPVSADLPAVLAMLSREPDVEFLGLQAHQEHAWHTFCCQLAALAVARAGIRALPVDAAAWRRLLRKLTDGRDEPWTLVVDDLRQPAFLQPPVPSDTLRTFKDAESPSELDVLVTSKNHDVKAKRISAARPEHWIYALVTLQTFEGFLGVGNYGVVRMNGGYGSRAVLGRDGSAGCGARFRRDTAVLLETRAKTAKDHRFNERGHALLWLLPWDGEDSVPLLECDPHFIEICRRVRLVFLDGKVQGRRTSSKVPRVDGKAGKGDTGDAWTPIARDAGKALTVSGSGFDYRLMHELLLSDSYVESNAMAQRPGDSVLRASVLVRGQGETQGLHRRALPIPERIGRILSDPVAKTRLGARSKDQIQVVETVRQRILHPGLCALQQGAPEKLRLEDHRDRDLLSELDREVDGMFFLWLFEDAELPAEEAARRWQQAVLDVAARLLRRAQESQPISRSRYYGAVVAAERIFYGTARKQFPDLSQKEERDERGTQPYLAEQQGSKLPDTIDAIAAYLGTQRGAGHAAAAQLRRQPAGELPGTAFVYVARRYLAPFISHGPRRALDERRWGTILQTMAVLAGSHAPSVRLGRALAMADAGESRLLQLLRARGEALPSVLLTCARLLSSRRQAANQVEIARLVLSEEGEHEESTRHQVAKDFYSTYTDAR